MLEVVFVPHRQVVGLLLCISVGWAPSPFELAFGDEFYPSPFVTGMVYSTALFEIARPCTRRSAIMSVKMPIFKVFLIVLLLC